jgi:ribosomal protein S18 acetylase RimI-like enzyme
MEDIFENPRNLNYLLKDFTTEKIVGYTCASVHGDGAYIMNTAISKEWQNRGKVAVLMRRLEEELKSRGVEYITRDSAVENGYADKIQKYYGDKIIETRDRESPWGLQRYFKIRI